MNSGRMDFEDFLDIQGVLSGLKELEKANEQWVNKALAHNEKYRQSIALIKEEIANQKQLLINLTAKERRVKYNQGFPEEVDRNTRALAGLNAALKRNQEFLDLNKASVDQIKGRISDLKKEYDSLDRSEAKNVQRMSEISREIKITSAAVNSLSAATRLSVRVTEDAENSYDRAAKQLVQWCKQLKALNNAFLKDGSINKFNAEAVELAKNIGQVDKQLKAADKSMGRFARNVGDYPKGKSGIFGNILGLASNSLGGSAGGMAEMALGGLGASAGVASVAAIAAGLTAASISVRAEYEKLDLLLENSLNNNKRATAEASAMIKSFADKSPLEIGEVTEAFTRLVDIGIIATEDQLRQLSDVAISKNKSIKDYVEAIADAQRGEFERLKEFGIDASKSGDKVIFTFKGVRTEIQNNEKAINDYLIGLGKVPGVMGATEKLAGSLSGKWSTLLDTLKGTGNIIGTALEPSLKKVIDLATNAIGWLNKLLTEHRGIVDQVIKGALSVLPAGGALAAGYQKSRDEALRKEQTDARRQGRRDRLGEGEQSLTQMRADAAGKTTNKIQTDAEKKDAQQKADEALRNAIERERLATKSKLNILEESHKNGLLTEAKYELERAMLQEESIKRVQKLYRNAGKEKTNDYLQTEVELTDLAKDYAGKRKELAEKSLTEAIDIVKEETQRKLALLGEQFEDRQITEQEYLNKRYDLEASGIRTRLDLLKNAGKAESKEAKDLDTQLIDSNRQRLRDQRKLDEKNWKEALQLTKEALQEINREQKSTLDEQLAALEVSYNQEQQLIELKNARGEISERETDDLLYNLKKEHLQKMLDLQVDNLRLTEKLEVQRLNELYKTAKTQEERERITQEVLKVTKTSQMDVDDAIAQNRIKVSGEATGKEISDTKKVEDARKQALENYRQAALEAVNMVFDNQRQASDNYLAGLEKQKEREIEAVGDSAERRKAIEERYDNQVRQIKRRQAVQEKLQAAFTVGVNTAVAISKASAALPSPANIPLIVAASVLGAVQLAAVLSKPLPQYKDGKNLDALDTYAGPALVGEAGRELWIHGGKAEVVDRPSVLNVGRNDVILPNRVTERLFEYGNTAELYSQLRLRRDYSSLIGNPHSTQQVLTKGGTLSQMAIVEAIKMGFSNGSLSQKVITDAIKEGFTDIEVHQWNVIDGQLTDVVVNGNQRRVNAAKRHRLS